LKNKHITLILCLSIGLNLWIGHKVHGNSETTMSAYEVAKYYIKEARKQRKSKKLADHIYERILYWQKVKGVNNVE